ncbi:hypothetical protein ACFWH1_18715 [Streptomyces sp. NPDC127037]|uniref:hypothetical protein n=1 Tax=Streptomyces sp. NPDC127037 TaxID=3347113 RepID=UPI00366493F2
MSTFITRDPATGMRRGPIRWPDGDPPTIDGCRWCGHDSFEHQDIDDHDWELPTAAQMDARSKAYRKWT